MTTKKILAGLFKFIVFFMLIAFVVTCSFVLFFHFMDYTEEEMRQSAPITFANVILITLIFWVCDTVRTHFTVDRPISRITEGLRKITAGRFDTVIEPIDHLSDENGYNVIISEINRMTAELAGVETLRTDFISNVSHEMKTPLSVINNYGQLLQSSGLTDSERREYAEAITASATRLSEMITNILKLNKLENQQIFPERREYDLGEQLAECLLQFERRWEQKGIEIETDIAENVRINADSELLSIVWNNLFSNAIKFTEPGGTVFVGLQANERAVKVTVRDTGCGMDADTGRHIFEKFYQGDTSHSVQGNGLGLALVKRVIDIENGKISVDSELGKGTTFVVTFNNSETIR